MMSWLWSLCTEAAFSATIAPPHTFVCLIRTSFNFQGQGSHGTQYRIYYQEEGWTAHLIPQDGIVSRAWPDWRQLWVTHLAAAAQQLVVDGNGGDPFADTALPAHSHTLGFKLYRLTLNE